MKTDPTHLEIEVPPIGARIFVRSSPTLIYVQRERECYSVWEKHAGDLPERVPEDFVSLDAAWRTAKAQALR